MIEYPICQANFIANDENCKSSNKSGNCRKCTKFCTPCGTFRYIQPARVKSVRPVSQICPAAGSMDKDTVYKVSFLPLEPCVARESRPKPIIHKDSVEKNNEKPETDTITYLSYPGHYVVKPASPVLPIKANFIGDGHVCIETTQKHDFLPKYSKKRSPIVPKEEIPRQCGAMERNTTNKVSFLPINVKLCPPPKPLRPLQNYERPTTAMESDTIQKLSYVKVGLQPKEEYPWAKKKQFTFPVIPMDKETTYKLSFLKTCASERAKPVYPATSIRQLGDGQFYGNDTIYKNSFMGKCGQRPQAIIPKSEIILSSGSGPLEKDSVYKLSFPGYCGITRSTPILPCPTSLRSFGPFTGETTQKHDYVCKFQRRRKSKYPKSNSVENKGSFDCSTTAKLSYMMPNMKNFSRAKPIFPVNSYEKPEGKMDCETTHQLSFIPINPPRREPLPWAFQCNYERPSGPMCRETVQKTSYKLPGHFVPTGESCCCNYSNPEKFCEMSYPKAAIVN